MFKKSIYLTGLLILALSIGTSYGATSSAAGNINVTVGHQVLDGFGASGAWYEGDVVTYGNSHPEIYNILFRDLGLDIYRIRNTYQIADSTSYMGNTATIIANGNATMSRPLRIMNTSWSPPASLKSNGNTRQGTLAKDGSGNYRYADFAQWWRDSLTAWTTAGVTTYYVNMQNEPNFVTSGWDTCQFLPTQTSSLAGYEEAFAALYANLNTMPNRPLLLAPEGQNIGFTADYVNALTSTDKSNVYGYSHHLYDGSADAPDAFISPMATLKAALAGDNKPLMQTEFSGGGPYTYTDEMNLAKLMHNALTVEEVSAYLYWELFWNNGTDSLVNVTSSSYAINPVYWPMKHYSYFTDPNWQRIDADTNSTSLRISAFIDPDRQKLSAIILNTDTTTDVNLTLSFTGFTVTDGNVWCSTSSQNCALTGSFTPGSPVTLPANSITTLQLFSSEPPEPPDKASLPNPADGATGVNLTTDLSWTAGSRATSHDVYFGTTSPGTFQGNQTQTSFDTGIMASNTTYFWRIDEKNIGGTTTGDTWSFTTAPPDTAPPTPNPLTWAAAPTATGAYTITMSATTATDDNSPPVQYYFECTNDANKTSGWQSSPTYLASGLTPSTQYTFRAKARDSAPALNTTGWSTSLSATTQPPPTNIEILGSWTTGTTHAKEPGYNRALIFIAHGEHPSSNMNLTSVTYGGQAMTKIMELNVGTGYRAYVAAYLLKEAGIVAATSSTFTPTWSDSSGAYGYASVFLQNVDQTNSIGATASNSTNSGTDPISTSTSLATSNGDMVIFGATCNNLGSYTPGGGFTEGTDQQFGDATTGGTGETGYKAATGANETPNADYSATVGRQVIIGFVVKAGPPPDTAPAAPTGLIATAGNKSIILTWNSNGEPDMNGYNLYRSMTSGGGYAKVNSLLLTNTTYTDTNLTNGTPYYYVVTAVDLAGHESTNSGEATATPAYQTCADALADGYRFPADLAGTGDCYVNFLDFVVLAGHWLDTNCASTGNCDGADFEPNGAVDIFDLSEFANQWLLCNDPANPNCTQNW
ncbi:MAG: fibronectin type III domain-containing protein [Sedimentisphaerales bacterium]